MKHPLSIFARVCACLAGLGLLFWRKPQAFRVPQMWAEDGTVFFREAYNFGIDSLVTRYAGYFHVVPRLSALSAVNFAPAWAPEIFSFVCVCAFLFVSWFITSPRISLRYQLFLPALIALVPVGGEAFLNLTNVQWTLAWLIVLILLAQPPKNIFERLHDLVCLLLSGLSGLFSVFFFPLFCLKFAFVRSRWNMFLLTIDGIVAAIQVIGLGALQRAPSVESPNYVDFWRVLGRPFHAFLFGPHALLQSESAAFEIVLGVVTLVVTILALWRAIRTHNQSAMILLGAYALIWGAVLLSIKGDPSILLGGGDRYFFLQPQFFVIALCATQLLNKKDSNLLLELAFASVAIYCLDYREAPLKDIRWHRQLRCLRDTPSHPCIIAVQPTGWSFALDPNDHTLNH